MEEGVCDEREQWLHLVQLNYWLKEGGDFSWKARGRREGKSGLKREDLREVRNRTDCVGIGIS